MAEKCDKLNCKADATVKGMGYKYCDKHNEEFEEQLEEDKLQEYALDAMEEAVVSPVYYEEYPFSDDAGFDDDFE